MKTPFAVKTAFILFSVCLYLIPASICSGLGKSEGIPADEKTPYKVPAEKAQKWDALKNVALKDYDVCLEHCGYEQACLDRCETVYKSRLDREYKLLLNEKETDPDK